MSTIGFDPEFLVRHMDSGEVTPICGLLGGTKQEPIPMLDIPGFMMHEDNVCAEISCPPGNDPQQAMGRLLEAISYLDEELVDRRLRRWDLPEHEFDSGQLNMPGAREFGCDADFDAYTGGKQRNNVPSFGSKRFAGGHIHLGGEFNCPKFVVALFCDLVLGIERSPANVEIGRAAWYGKAGVFRPKEYGIEYRTLSNAWCNNAGSQSRVEDTIYKAWDLLLWLENTSATNIKKVCDEIQWLDVRAYMDRKRSVPSGSLPHKERKGVLRVKAMTQLRLAQKLGVPA